MSNNSGQFPEGGGAYVHLTTRCVIYNIMPVTVAKKTNVNWNF